VLLCCAQGDITPTTPLEVMLALLFMAVGVSMVALLIGSMTELLTQATSDAREDAGGAPEDDRGESALSQERMGRHWVGTGSMGSTL